jgi:hypothetical protein
MIFAMTPEKPPRHLQSVPSPDPTESAAAEEAVRDDLQKTIEASDHPSVRGSRRRKAAQHLRAVEQIVENPDASDEND